MNILFIEEDENQEKTLKSKIKGIYFKIIGKIDKLNIINDSYKNVAIPKDMVIMGEVGLTGEVRRINFIEKRLIEAEKLGFKRCIIPENNKKSLKSNFKLDIIGVPNIGEALKKLGMKNN